MLRLTTNIHQACEQARSIPTAILLSYRALLYWVQISKLAIQLDWLRLIPTPIPIPMLTPTIFSSLQTSLTNLSITYIIHISITMVTQTSQKWNGMNNMCIFLSRHSPRYPKLRYTKLQCNTCMKTKSMKPLSSIQDIRTSRVRELVHSVLRSPSLLQRKEYVITLVDVVFPPHYY